MARVRLSPLLIVPTIFLVGHVASGSGIGVSLPDPARQQFAPVPILYAERAAGGQNVILVIGQYASPGEGIYLAMYDEWGVALHEMRWIEEGATYYGPNGNQDPARSFPEEGYFRETFEAPCGERVMLRAYAQVSGAWSVPLLVDLSCDCGSVMRAGD